MADPGQQINLVVNRPYEDYADEIDLRRVFHNMKSRIRLYAWVMVLCLLVGVCVPLLLYPFTKAPLTVSSVVTLSYDAPQKDKDGAILTDESGKALMAPVSDLTAPDGEELDLNQITSSYVLQSALRGLTLSQPLSLTDLRDNIRIERILTEESRRQQEVASRMLSDKNSAAYTQIQNIKLAYTNTFVVSLTNGFGKKGYELTSEELQLVLDRALSAYNESLAATYADMRMPNDVFSAIDIDALDIQESLELIRAGVQELYDFCDGKADAIKTYRSRRTGYSLEELMAELETVRTVSVDYLYAHAQANNIVRDKNALITTYRYQLRSAQTRLDVLNEKIAADQDILNNYKNDEIFVSMQESDTAKSAKATTEYYNRLVLEQADNYDRAAELETEITDLTDKLSRLNDESAPASLDPKQIEEELSAVLATCQKAYAQISDQMEEIINSPSFTNYTYHSVAQGQVKNFIVANLKKMAIGGAAGLFIACGLWFLSGIAPEFKLEKDGDDRRKEGAK